MIEKLKQDRIQAMKDKNETLKNVIGIILTNIQMKEKMGKSHELEDNEIIKIIEKEITQIKDTISYLKDEKQIKEEQEKIDYLQQYIPAKMSEEEVKETLLSLLKENNIEKTDIKTIMKTAKEK
jgi:gatB/yqey domain-containing protein